MSSRRDARNLLCSSVVTALLATGVTVSAHAQGKLEAHYTASLAGIPIGKGIWVVDISDEQYSAAASGKTTGIMQVFSGGQGSVAGRGTLNGKPLSSDYTSTIVVDKKTDAIHIAVNAGNVKDFSAEPPWPATPDRVPVTEAHRKGVLDPMSAWLMPAPGNGDPVKPEACRRTLAVFDGRGRFDLALTFKRMDRVKADKGYEGPVVVCAVQYVPIAGHRPNRAAIKYLVEQRDIEVALAPLAGTRIVVPYRISVPTVLGAAVLEASQFMSGPQTGRPAAATTNAKTF